MVHTGSYELLPPPEVGAVQQMHRLQRYVSTVRLQRYPPHLQSINQSNT